MASDLDSSASALAGATESYTVGSDPAFWSNSVSFPADMQTVVVGTKLIFNYSDYQIRLLQITSSRRILGSVPIARIYMYGRPR